MAGGIRRMDDLYCIGGKGKTIFYFLPTSKAAPVALTAIVGWKGHIETRFLCVQCSI